MEIPKEIRTAVAQEPYLRGAGLRITMVLGAGASAGLGITLLDEASRKVYGTKGTRAERPEEFDKARRPAVEGATRAGRIPAAVALANVLKVRGHHVKVITTKSKDRYNGVRLFEQHRSDTKTRLANDVHGIHCE